jgi:hypothetical protein
VILELALVHRNLNGTTWVAVAQAKHAKEYLAPPNCMFVAEPCSIMLLEELSLTQMTQNESNAQGRPNNTDAKGDFQFLWDSSDLGVSHGSASCFRPCLAGVVFVYLTLIGPLTTRGFLRIHVVDIKKGTNYCCT